jgi:hypothetical protein
MIHMPKGQKQKEWGNSALAMLLSSEAVLERGRQNSFMSLFLTLAFILNDDHLV